MTDRGGVIPYPSHASQMVYRRCDEMRVGGGLLDGGDFGIGRAVGPVWTPLLPATMDADRVESFGDHTPFKRPAQLNGIAPSHLFAAGALSSYYSGEVLAPIGGETLPG